MGRFVFKLPDVGEGVAEAEIVAWHVAPGQRIKEDQPLVDVMTDKATVEMTSPVSGVVSAIHGGEGDTVAVGSDLAEIEVDAPGERAATNEISPTTATAPLASPAVRRRARELGLDLDAVAGSGPGGRVVQHDLDAAQETTIPVDAAAESVRGDGVESIKVIGLRRRIAAKMQESKRRIPHFAYVDEVDVTELEALRERLNRDRAAGQEKLSILPFLVRALTRTLPHWPQINARFDDEAGVVHRHRAVHMGIATQTSQGLMVPVMRHAEALGLWAAAAEIARLSAAARSGKISRQDLTGSTITITSLGALGGLATTPVINHPEVAIIAPNRIVERPVVRGGQVVARKMMNLSASFDHRVVDGYDAASFIQAVKAVLEDPASLLSD